MSFLSPLLFLGLGTIAVPIFVHLIQRERKRVIEFPSLMFVQKIPYQSVQRRRLRHWFLLLMRAAAIALIVAAFARPFFPGGAEAALNAAGGSREVVIVLDHSASMGYGDRWQRARAAATNAIGALGVGDRATLVTFGRSAEELIRATADRGRLEATLGTTELTAGGTRFGPALKLAESVLTRSALPRREAILISDFQKSGWSGSEDVHFGEGLVLTPVVIGDDNPVNIAVPSVSFARAPFQNQERITVTAGVVNKSAQPAKGVQVTLEIDGHQLESKAVDIAANAAASVTFAPFTLSGPGTHGVVRAGTDAMAIDNSFDFVLNPSQALSVLLVDGGTTGSNFYVEKALAIGNTPTFQIETLPAARVTPQSLERRSVVVFNDTVLPPGLGLAAIKSYLERGGGVLVVFGQRSSWPQNDTEIFPGKVGGVIDRTDDGRGATIGFRDYSHPIFEVFKAPRSGDFSAPRIQRYRTLEPGPTDRVLARFDDGAVAAVERRVGAGRIIALTTSLDDSWNDLARKPVYLPLLHQVTRYLGQYEPQSAWSTVGQVVDVAARLKSKADRTIVTPQGTRTRMGADEPSMLELVEHGVYEIRPSNDSTARPERIAVNVDPAESDLAAMDPAELVAAVTGKVSPSATTATGDAAASLTPEEAEKQQNLWWYLLITGLLLLIAENVVANRLSLKERFT